MKSKVSPIQVNLDQQYGMEPILLLEVEWVAGAPILYSDRKIMDADYPYPTILEMSDFDNTMVLGEGSDSLQLKVTLDDSEGHLKNIISKNDVHRRPAKIYLIYSGMSLVDKMFLYDGEVVTPFTWSEKHRSLAFTVLAEPPKKQVGFSMEEGDFANIPEEALGKAWPLVFGQVCHVPAVKTRAPRQGRLKSGTGIQDFTLEPRLCQARNLMCKAKETESLKDCMAVADTTQKRTECYMAAKEAAIEKQDANLQKLMNGEKVDATSDVDQECLTRRRSEICRLKQTIADQKLYETSPLDIEGGVNFPQDIQVELSIDGAIFKGIFTGNSFEVMYREHPAHSSYKHEACKITPNSSVTTYSLSIADAILEVAGKYGTYYRFIDEAKYSSIECEYGDNAKGQVGGPPEAWKTYGLMTDESFFWMPAGTEVYLLSESEHLHVVSLTAGTVDTVAAYKAYADGRSMLTEIPPEFYTVYKTDYGDYYVTEIGMSKRMSLYNEWFSDDLFVSYTSDIGPNLVDIIAWLVETYTNLSIDSVSFEAVRERVEKYPVNFYLLDRPEVGKLMRDLAYQSRCGIYIRNKIVTLVYLPIEPDAVRTISESDIVAGTFKESMSNTDNLITSHSVRWQQAGASADASWPESHLLQLKYNIDKYGTNDYVWDYYTLNMFDLVLKSSTFWLIRKSNSWRELEFDVPMRHIDLEIGDAINVNVSQFSASTIKCIITKAQFKPKKNLISLRCWTPIKTGDTEPYYWAWPSQKSVQVRWPLPNDENGSLGYLEVNPPIGHVLLGGYGHEEQVYTSTGDLHPSDLDDTKPVTTCEFSDDIDVEEIPWQARNQSDATSSHVAAMEAQTPPDKWADNKCGYPSNGRCGYLVKIRWHKPDMVDNGDGECSESQEEGEACSGYYWTKCHTFGAPTAAKNFWYEMQSRSKDPANPVWKYDQADILIMQDDDIYRDITEGRMITEGLHFVCEYLWCPKPGDLSPCGVAEPFQHQGEFGHSKYEDCFYSGIEEIEWECPDPTLL